MNCNKLSNEIQKCIRAVLVAQNHFDNALSSDEIDAAILEINIARAASITVLEFALNYIGIDINQIGSEILE